MRTPTTARTERRDPKRGAESARPAEAEHDAAGEGQPRTRKSAGSPPLFSAIAHDLRAPLAAVTMGANFVLQAIPRDDVSGRSRRVLEAMLRSCKQMERLIRDFGDLSEIEADAVGLRLGVHDAGEIATIAAEAARSQTVGRPVQITVTRPDVPLVLSCDRDRILRALAQLLDNALRFAPDETRVEIAVSETDRAVVFGVTDRGPGLSEETRAHLFDRVWHAKRAGRAGAGLGLAIVQGFVAAHAGHVDVDSKPGATTFSLVLPKDLPKEGEAGSSPETGRDARNEGEAERGS